MNRPEQPKLTWQQLLAAFADGELVEPARRQAHAWLAEHPDALSELKAQRALSPSNVPFWDAVSLDRPGELAWARVWNSIEAELDWHPQTAPRSRARSRWWKRGLMVALLAMPATAAATVVATLCLPVRPPARVADVQSDEGSEEVFQLAGVGDVQILSVRDADVPQLVIGEPPFNESMALVSSGDVRLESLQPAWDGFVPEVQLGGGVNAPMIFIPISRTP